MSWHVFKDENGDVSVVNQITRRLKGCISQFAIRMITTEIFEAYDKENKDTSIIDNCDCEIRVNFLLPCQHTLRKMSRTMSGLVIDPETIDSRWHLRKSQSKCF